jgi:hypothetical protein
MPRELFSRIFKPAAQLGDVVLLLGSSDFFPGASGCHAFEVVAVEAIPVLGPHGQITVWTQGGAAIATFPFLLDAGAASGSIGLGGGAVTTQALNSFKNQVDEVTQLRFLVKAFGTLPGSWAIEDLDVQMSQPGSTRRWSVANATGVLNAMLQAQIPADAGVAPAQGANASLPAAYIAQDPFDLASRGEIFVYRDAAPTVTLVNNGSVAMNSAMGVNLMAAGFKYRVRAFDAGPTPFREVEILGLTVRVPAWLGLDELRWRVPILPVAGRG